MRFNLTYRLFEAEEACTRSAPLVLRRQADNDASLQLNGSFQLKVVSSRLLVRAEGQVSTLIRGVPVVRRAPTIEVALLSQAMSPAGGTLRLFGCLERIELQHPKGPRARISQDVLEGRFRVGTNFEFSCEQFLEANHTESDLILHTGAVEFSPRAIVGHIEASSSSSFPDEEPITERDLSRYSRPSTPGDARGGGSARTEGRYSLSQVDEEHFPTKRHGPKRRHERPTRQSDLPGVR